VATDKFHFGLKIGSNMATLSGHDEGSTVMGLNFGLAAYLKLSDSFYLAPEFCPVARKGIKDIPHFSRAMLNWTRCWKIRHPQYVS
jgi:hypothetical protein